MESANLQLPADQLVGSPPNLAAPSCYGFGSTNVLAPWSSSPPTTSFTNIDGIVSNSLTRQKNSSTTGVHDPNNGHRDVLVSSEIHISDLSSSSTTSTTTAASNLAQDIGGFPTSDNQSDYNDQLARIKEEFSEISFPKFTELLNSRPTTSNIDDYYYGNSLFKAGFRDLSCCSSAATVADPHQQQQQQQHHHHHHHHHHQNPLLVKTNLSSSSSICHHNINAPEFDHSNGTTATPADYSSSGFGGLAVQGCRGQFSQIYPSVNVSNLTPYSLMGMNLMKPTGLDHNHFASARFYTSNSVHGQPFSHFGVDPIQQQHRLSFSGHSKSISSFNSEMKRQNSLMEPKTSTHNKKSRLESRTSSCPPFKVRKEKLGDRIAALQQLVSPFGKTDTASVLMEAIGYIKFLQSQVETLSVPYMKSSRNKCGKTMHGSQKDHHQSGNGDQEPKRDLKSRGLCLVPLSCMSYVTGDGGGGSSIWPPLPNFGTGRISID